MALAAQMAAASTAPQVNPHQPPAKTETRARITLRRPEAPPFRPVEGSGPISLFSVAAQHFRRARRSVSQAFADRSFGLGDATPGRVEPALQPGQNGQAQPHERRVRVQGAHGWRRPRRVWWQAQPPLH